LAPDEGEVTGEAVLEVADLAPEPGTVLDVAELAPDETEATGETVVEIVDLAPEPEPVLDVAELAPDEAVFADEPEAGAELVLGEIDEEPMVTRTMAELFMAQGLEDRALKVFRQLLEATPGDAGLRKRVAELSARSDAPEAIAEVPEPAPPIVPEDQVGSPADSSGDEDDLSGHVWDADAQAVHHDVDTPFAWTHQDPEEVLPEGPPISAYFARMLDWEPGAAGRAETREVEAESDGGDDLTRWINRDDS